ncbi:MAG TPA: alginate export family protein, partial [Elusimicrobiales bacterium]|nr:alginate export family protein [Elusimicrobiales bacterium]
MLAYGSGDNKGLNSNGSKNLTFQPINPDFHPGLIFGMADLAGANFGNFYGLNGTYYNQGSLANLTVLNIGIDYMPKFSEKLSFLVDFYNFKINQDCTGNVGTDKTIGSEIDLNVNYKFAENVTLGIAGGHFMPGNMIKKLTTANNPANKLASYITVKW